MVCVYTWLVTTLVPPSGYYLCNRLGRVLLESLEETIGRNGLNALLNLTNAGHYIENPPPDDMVMGFDLAAASNLNRAMEMIYGPRGARGLALRSGRAMFDRIADSFDLPTGFTEFAFRLLPLQTRLKLGVPALARALTHYSDQTHRVSDRGPCFDYSIDRCAVCWGQKAGAPMCFLTVGLLQEALSTFGRGQEFRIIQTECRAVGAAACVFRIEKEPIA